MKHISILWLLIAFCIPAGAQPVPEFLTNKSNFCTTISGYQGEWSLIGPKSFTTPTTEPYVSSLITQYLGRIEAVWVDPSDEDHMLAASNSGGLFEWTSSSFVAMSSTMYASILPYLLAPPAPATTKPYVKTRVSVTPPSRGRQVTHLPIFPQAAIHSGNKPIPKSIIITIATVRMHPLQAPVFVLFQMIA